MRSLSVLRFFPVSPLGPAHLILLARHTRSPLSLSVNKSCAAVPSRHLRGLFFHAYGFDKGLAAGVEDSPLSSCTRVSCLGRCEGPARGVLLHDRENGDTADIIAFSDRTRAGLRGGPHGDCVFYPGILLSSRFLSHSPWPGRKRRSSRCSALAPNTCLVDFLSPGPGSRRSEPHTVAPAAVFLVQEASSIL